MSTSAHKKHITPPFLTLCLVYIVLLRNCCLKLHCWLHLLVSGSRIKTTYTGADKFYCRACVVVAGRIFFRRAHQDT